MTHLKTGLFVYNIIAVSVNRNDTFRPQAVWPSCHVHVANKISDESVVTYSFSARWRSHLLSLQQRELNTSV